VTPTETQLQQFQRALADVIVDARDTLDTRAYLVFLDWLCAVVAREVARFIGWEERP
jgi:hypothetical protein